MNSLRFEWDSQKAAVNAKKHGVSNIIRIISARKASAKESQTYP